MDGRVRCEWGLNGIEALKDKTDVFIIVDVLSFTTCVDVAVARGACIYPFAWKDERLAAFALQNGALAAVSSRETGFSLSPRSLLEIPSGTRFVLPSPNGATLSLATGPVLTLAGCLRNAKAVAEAALGLGGRISIIAGGERWQDQSLRPAIEDFLGAGAILSNLHLPLTAEAELARIAFEGAKERLGWFLETCASGRELIERGRAEDIRIAGALDQSNCVPILRDSAYTHL